jgi:hypothetical protein
MDHGKMFGLLPECDPAPPPAPRLKPLDRLAQWLETPRGERVFNRIIIMFVTAGMALTLYGAWGVVRGIVR